jgi:hypothetical protein
MKPHEAAFWAALRRVAEKQEHREALAGGSVYPVELVVTGVVAEQAIGPVKAAGNLTVGHDVTRAKTSGPDQVKLVSWFLSRIRVGKRRQEAIDQVMAELGSFEPEAKLAEESKKLLERLRTTEPQSAKGPVSFLAAEPAKAA